MCIIIMQQILEQKHLRNTCGVKKVKVDEFSASLKDTYRQEIVEFLKQKLTSKQYDGIFAVTDEYALVAKEAIGVIQPDLLKEIEIIGFDGARGSKESRIKVDSIQQPIEDIVKEAVSVLIRKIKGEEIGNNYKKNTTCFICKS